MCSCGPEVQIGGYQNTVAVEIPAHMSWYRAARRKAGLTELICLDRCVEDEIKFLWKWEVKTYGSCCGHNQLPSMVNVGEFDMARMEILGYKLWENIPDGMWPATYYLKSCGTPERGEEE